MRPLLTLRFLYPSPSCYALPAFHFRSGLAHGPLRAAVGMKVVDGALQQANEVVGTPPQVRRHQSVTVRRGRGGLCVDRRSVKHGARPHTERLLVHREMDHRPLTLHSFGMVRVSRV